MAELRMEFTLITQPLRGVSGLCLGELLRLPEITTVAGSSDSAWLAVVNLAEKFLGDVAPGGLWQRSIAPGAAKVFSLRLDVDPPRRQGVDDAWVRPATMEFHGVKWKRSDGVWLAYVPLLVVGAMADREADLEGELERELRFAVQQSGWRQEGTTELGLRELALLQCVEGLALESVSIPVKARSPKTRAREETEEPGEKSVLGECATDLITLPLPAAYELDETAARIAEALQGRGARSVLLVGASGVGKTAAFYEVVRLREKLGLADRPFWSTSGSRLVLGALGYGAWQERCHKFCREAGQTRAIVYLGNLVELLEVGKSESNAIGIAGQLRSYMARGELLAVVECTPEQLALLERDDPHLLAVFRQVRLEEPPSATVRAILQKVGAEATAGDARKRGKDLERLPVLTDAALGEIERLHRRFAAYSAFPGRAIRFLRNVLRDGEGKGLEPGATINTADVVMSFARETGLPMMLLSDEQALDIDATRDWFGARVMAQRDAVTRVIDVLAMVKAALNRPRRPIASLLFIGPTGVGKTEMAKALAEFFFSDRARLVRFDMSEFATPAAVARLVGGLGAAEGLLTSKVREQPFLVLLLDEIEKAHGSFFDLMLQVLGEGRLTDSAGRTADFSNCVVIMTSNLGAASFDRGSFGLRESRRADPTSHFVEEVRAFLRPELFNRIDRLVPFLPLDARAIRDVAGRELTLVKQRDGLRLRDVDVAFTPAVIGHLAKAGFDPALGARPLKRTIERELLAPLADALNGYADTIPLAAGVGLENDALIVHVRAKSETGSAPIRGLGPAIAQRAGKTRRSLQRLMRSGTVLRVQNEIFNLNRQIDRVLSRAKMQHPMLPAWRDRLKRLQEPAAEAQTLLQESIDLEEQALLAFYEQDNARANSRDWMKALGDLEGRLQKVLLALYALRYPNPDRITMGIFGPVQGQVMDLCRAYLRMATRRAIVVDGAWFTQDIRGFLRHREEAPARFVQAPTGKLLGVGMEFNGPSAALVFEAEAGVHTFKVQGKESACEVVISKQGLAQLEPVVNVEALPHGLARRAFDLTNKVVRDQFGPRDEPFEHLADAVERLADARPRMLIREPLGEEEP